MEATDLKKFLDTFDKAELEMMHIFIDDANGCSGVRVVNVCQSETGIYLSIGQEFPSEWFDPKTNRELWWVDGRPVVPSYEEQTDDYIIDDSDEETTLELHDGYATLPGGIDPVLTYPKMADLTQDELEEANRYTGGRISDSGYVDFGDLALAFGEVVKKNPTENEPAQSESGKIYIVEIDGVENFNSRPHRVKVYSNYEKAKRHFDDLVHEFKQNNIALEWEEQEGIDSYEAYPDGEWQKDHFAVYLYSEEIL